MESWLLGEVFVEGGEGGFLEFEGFRAELLWLLLGLVGLGVVAEGEVGWRGCGEGGHEWALDFGFWGWGGWEHVAVDWRF